MWVICECEAQSAGHLVAVPAHATVTGLNRHELTVTFPFVVSLSNHELSNENSCRINSACAHQRGRARRAAAAPKSARE